MRSRAFVAAALVALSGSLWACVRLPEGYPAFRIPESEFRQAVKTLCVAPLRSPFAAPEGDTRVRDFEGLIVDALTGAGYTVVPAAQVEPVWQRALFDQGGYFDADTGERDETKYQRVRQGALQRLAGELHCQAMVFPTLALVFSGWQSGVASWDGVSAKVSDDFLGGSYGFGRVPCLSLWISIVDLSDREIYFGTGGIEVLAKLESDFFREKFATVETVSVLRNSAANREAVQRGLGPVIGVSADRPTPTPRWVAADSQRARTAQAILDAPATPTPRGAEESTP